ncbi:amidase family protein [Xylaria arbuscula]|nr:amidase family protein [Xylaria arbuscula]
MSPCHDFILEEATIQQLQAAYDEARLTTTQVVTCFLDRIQQTNGWLSSIQETNPDALSDAARLDKERSSGKIRGPLHGIPYVVKDNMATDDKMETTAGSWVLMGSRVPRDAFVVSRLREAGTVLLGKAALTEWAHMRSSNLSEGYSARGGQVRSPYNFTVNPGGSSSGSAASVASNQCVFSLGTETDGSIVIPAERNALVGIKPTVGLTSRSGVIPETRHQDTVGVLGRTVSDAALALDGIYGVDARDPFTSQQQGKTPPNGFAQFVTNRDVLKNARFGIPWKSFWALNSPEQNLKLLEIIQLLVDEGATVVNGTELDGWEMLVNPKGWDWDWRGTLGFPNESEYTVVKVDFYNDIKSYLSELSDSSIKSVEDIIRYNIDALGSEGGLPGVNSGFLGGQERFHESAGTKGVEDDLYRSALSFTQSTSRRGIDSALGIGRDREKPLDALLVPTDLQQAASVAAQAGYPLITVPAGVNNTRTGMPYGLMLMGTAWSEAVLIKWASAVEDTIVTHKGKRALPQWKDSRRRVLPIVYE